MNAIPQQPKATMAGNMRLCGPETAGERKRRLILVVLVLVALLFPAGTARLFCEFEALCAARTTGDCALLALAGAFLRLWDFGITLTHLPGSDLPGTDSPGSDTFC